MLETKIEAPVPRDVQGSNRGWALFPELARSSAYHTVKDYFLREIGLEKLRRLVDGIESVQVQRLRPIRLGEREPIGGTE